MGDRAERETSSSEGPTRAKVGYLDILRIPEIRVVVAGTFVIMLGYGILSPVLPLYARSFHVGYDAVGLLVSAFAFARLVTDLGCGALVNRYGERAMVSVGALVVGVSSGLAAIAPTFTLLVLFRAAGGAGSAVFFAAMMSYLFKTAPKDLLGRVMGVFFGAFNLGIILGNPLGGVVAHFFGLASPLWFYAGACFLAAAVYVRSVRNPPRARPEDEVQPRGLRTLRWNRPFLSVLAANLAYFWMIAAVFSTLISLFGKDRVGLSPLGIGLGLAIASAAEFAVLFPAGSATDRLGSRAVVVPSFLATAVVVALFGLASSVVAFGVAAAFLGLGSGYGGVPIPVMLNDVVPPEQRAAAIGVYRFVGDLGFVFGPLVAGAMASAFGFPAAFAVSAIPLVVAAAIALTVPRTSSPPERVAEG
ncbi:MAG: MFS transporter [Actinomycetota bacterium]|nr:MFS transporter [Actinomycetota bacterium]